MPSFTDIALMVLKLWRGHDSRLGLNRVAIPESQAQLLF